MESLSRSSSISSSVVKVKLGDEWEEEEAKGKESLPWDDGGGYTGIRSITIGYSDFVGIVTIQVEYDLFGKSVLGQEHGADYMKVWKQRGATIVKRKFAVDLPGELVTGIYCKEVTDLQSGRRIIYDLELRTNRRAKGMGLPIESWMKPSLSLSKEKEKRLVEGGTAGGAIVGFFGSSDGQTLGSIGVYMAATAAGDSCCLLVDELHHQGLMPYRTSPLHLH